jgi:asparagine synthase (glutamine-hydrolysing)
LPGIVGLITRVPRERAERQLTAMVAAIAHEPFYVTGTWIDESLGVYVGWAAQKGSFADGMPLLNETGEVVLVFAGEEFPDPGRAARLTASGHALGSAEASYLVHEYEDDPKFPAGLNGFFHGLLVDRTRGTATLMNDRYGMQRLYCHEATDAFYFAAEAKAILSVRPELRSVDPVSVGELIALSAVLDDRTLFRSIFLLPAASAWKFRNGALETRTSYFHPKEWEEQPVLDADSYYRELREVFSQNLPRYFGGPQRVAMSLTGGLDTRAVMAWYRGSDGSLPCYTFGGTYRDCWDVRVARRIARVCGQEHHVIEAGADVLLNFPQLAERTIYLTDGCAEVSLAPLLHVCRQAREIAPVRVTGNYGDQILRGFRSFKPKTPAADVFRPELLAHVTAAGQAYSRIVDTHPVTFAAFRQSPWHHYNVLALEQTQLVQRSPFLDNDVVRVNFRAPAAAMGNNDARLRLIADGNPVLRRIRTDMGIGGKHEAFPGSIVRRFQDFTFKAEYAYDYGMPQWVSRIDHGLSRLHLERLFLGRHKFYHFRVWYRDKLSKYVQEMLLDPLTLSRPYLNRKVVEAVVRSHLKGDCNYTTEIHKLLSLELLHRQFIDESRRSAQATVAARLSAR